MPGNTGFELNLVATRSDAGRRRDSAPTTAGCCEAQCVGEDTGGSPGSR